MTTRIIRSQDAVANYDKSNEELEELIQQEQQLYAEDEQSSRSVPQQKLDRRPLKLTRNFMNFPLARDLRTHCEWRKDADTGELFTELPYEDRILLVLPPGTPKDFKHAPTGMDMAVLFVLLAEYQRTNKRRITLEYAAMLRRLAMNDRRTGNRDAVRASLDYWSRLTLEFGCWHEGKKSGLQRVLPPPFLQADEGPPVERALVRRVGGARS
jgi:hypothetical protein